MLQRFLNGSLGVRAYSLKALSFSDPNLMKLMCGDSLESWDQKDTKISKMPRLTDQQRGIAVGMLQAGMNQREIARQLGCSQATISKLRRRFEDTGSGRDKVNGTQDAVYSRSTGGEVPV